MNEGYIQTKIKELNNNLEYIEEKIHNIRVEMNVSIQRLEEERKKITNIIEQSHNFNNDNERFLNMFKEVENDLKDFHLSNFIHLQKRSQTQLNIIEDNMKNHINKNYNETLAAIGILCNYLIEKGIVSSQELSLYLKNNEKKTEHFFKEYNKNIE